ncbi:MAG: tRNA guanosine(34) transglycosylase Tgt [Parcubacteria group bacterium CG1_02_37_51]|uniref:Queuine tRNA-ribosyltransferase n=2 Tax=Candidatus Komeiliibacteriota TaxID=1817908 RepID=A0A2M8DQZ4_9BACT|nr:MAG: tRNA guanosine(34) transglycosylase Tgt [Parcubacteria group bacterium CG1_02_37_51]PIY95088.1 MAG: tRNA guanosine(34) transglycosylase Tgt [Candidatus Komeilibacteria bacterium CG_4_10_14_0_8_um_filter_37_78]PJC01750.1 MAG: tRNA guanosine(34) transglycosylase Tgt [Candidatus Komeilibacteria bacterium CG_4_9_14_0_8_um_filter_36_9]
MKNWQLKKLSKKSQARLGVLKTAHGNIATPFFMPIATKGAVKAIATQDLEKLQAQIILSNTYHQYLRPGLKILNKTKGLHNFMNWSGPILTDSGGFQVFSLDASLERKGISKSGKVKVDRQVTNQGVEFRSYLDGSKHLFTPEKVIKIQQTIGSDIMMVLDECVGNPSTKAVAKAAVERTTLWARQALAAKKKLKITKQQLFAIVQGSLYQDLRLQSVQELTVMDFDGFAIGGLAVGENNIEMYKVLDYTVPALPSDKPRYLMGVGYPENIIESVKRGVDMFDCVIPTREARHGRFYVRKKGWKYETVNITNSKQATKFSAINEKSTIPELREYTWAYLHHLFKTGEPLAIRLATLNNVEFYLNWMKDVRQAIKVGKL